jgi:hypothetical protein
MTKSIKFLLIVLILSGWVLSACSNSSADAPASAMEVYWKTMAAKDSAALSSLSCADYEATAVNNLGSFQSVDLKLKDLKCTTVSSTDATAEVTCQGALVASYGTEDTDFDLSNTTYTLVKESGNWLMCGEK